MRTNVLKHTTILLIFIGCFSSCDKPQTTPAEEYNSSIVDENLYQTWVLIEKEINNTKEVLPTDDKYPVILTFCSTKDFCGRHDANFYEGKYEINQGIISFPPISITDCNDIDWYWNYISELGKVNKVFIFSQSENTNNIKLQLSNQDSSINLYFINQKWFEKTYFELEDEYKHWCNKGNIIVEN